jgi:hypothetical protein
MLYSGNFNFKQLCLRLTKVVNPIVKDMSLHGLKYPLAILSTWYFEVDRNYNTEGSASNNCLIVQYRFFMNA